MKITEIITETKKYDLSLENFQRRFGKLLSEGMNPTPIKNTELNFLKYSIEQNVNPMLYYFALNQQIEKQYHSNIMAESINVKNEQTLEHIFDQFGDCIEDTPRVGDKVCLLELSAEDYGRNNRKIILSGFKTLKTVVKNDGTYIQFDDGSVYPEIPIIQTRVWKRIATFRDPAQLDKCLLIMELSSGKITSSDGDWIMSINLDDIDIKEADNPNYFGGSSMSPIPGTPEDLNDTRTQAEKRRDARRAHKKAVELQRWMGHK
jgi:hypothetical protein